MTTTPTVWKPEYRLNLFTNTLQADAAIVDIGGGRFIAVWTDYDNSVADTGGVNLVGQIFDAEGSSFGSPFQVNETAGTGLQQNAAVTARPGGGFRGRIPERIRNRPARLSGRKSLSISST